MPYKNPEQKRERARESYAANLERRREYNREKNREYRAKHRDKLRELERARDRIRREDPHLRDQRQRWRMANSDKMQQYRVRYVAANPYRRHDLQPEDVAAMWEAQARNCYLCGDPLDFADAYIDHDHRHCAARRSCRICQRGLAHNGCNRLIGQLADDPDRLRRIASNLEAAKALVTQRMSTAQRQPVLVDRTETP